MFPVEEEEVVSPLTRSDRALHSLPQSDDPCHQLAVSDPRACVTLQSRFLNLELEKSMFPGPSLVFDLEL